MEFIEKSESLKDMVSFGCLLGIAFLFKDIVSYFVEGSITKK